MRMTDKVELPTETIETYSYSESSTENLDVLLEKWHKLSPSERAGLRSKGIYRIAFDTGESEITVWRRRQPIIPS